MGDVHDVLTEEFCDSCNSFLVDTWLYRRSAYNNEKQYTFFTKSVADRIEFYDGIQSIYPVYSFLAFSKFKLNPMSANKINLTNFIKNVEEIDNSQACNNMLDEMNDYFHDFIQNYFIPFLEKEDGMSSIYHDFTNEIYLLANNNNEYKEEHDFSIENISNTVRLIQRTKTVFVKYYAGAYIHLDKYGGLFTMTEQNGVAHGIHRGEPYVSYINESELNHIKNLINKDVCVQKANIPVIQIHADIASSIGATGIKVDYRIRAAINLTLVQLKTMEGIYENYTLFRKRPEGEMLRMQLVSLVMNNMSYGGYLDEETTFQFIDEQRE